MISHGLVLIAGLLASLSWSSWVTESPTIPGPDVGQRFPHTLKAVDQSGRPQSLKSLMGPKGLAVFFVRSADCLDRHGVIRLRYQEPTYRTRPNLDGVLRDIEAAGL